jgi:AcrR family transcriptional regulator
MPKIVKDEVIYQVTIETILRCGYAGATTREIAAAAGVSEMTLFRKFESKARLVTQAFQMVTGRMDFASAARYSGDIAADLLRVVEHYQALVDRHGAFMAVLLVEIPREPELAPLLDEPISSLENIAALLARYQSEGLLRPEPPLQAAAALLGPLVYLMMMRSARPTAKVPAVDLQAHVTAFLSGRQV